MTKIRIPFILGAVVSVSAASAHPMHEVVQNAYLTLSSGRVELLLELTAGPQVAGRIIRSLDANGDRRITPVEAHAYADRVLAHSRLTIDGRPITIRTVSVDVPTYAALLGAHGTISIRAEAVRRESARTHMLAYHNGYEPAESRCDANIFIKTDDRTQYRIARQDRSPNGRDLIVNYTGG